MGEILFKFFCILICASGKMKRFFFFFSYKYTVYYLIHSIVGLQRSCIYSTVNDLKTVDSKTNILSLSKFT